MINADRYLTVNPGHGGPHAGAIAVNGTAEKVYNLKLALKMYAIFKKYLKERAKITRTNDIDIDDIVAAKKFIPNFLFDIHFNAFNKKARGIEIFVSKYNTKYKDFAFFLMKEFSKKFGIPTRDGGVKKNSSGADYYAIHRKTGEHVTAFLIETCFLDNKDDFKFISQPGILDKIAQFYCKHILENLYGIKMENETNTIDDAELIEIVKNVSTYSNIWLDFIAKNHIDGKLNLKGFIKNLYNYNTCNSDQLKEEIIKLNNKIVALEDDLTKSHSSYDELVHEIKELAQKYQSFKQKHILNNLKTM